MYIHMYIYYILIVYIYIYNSMPGLIPIYTSPWDSSHIYIYEIHEHNNIIVSIIYNYLQISLTRAARKILREHQLWVL